MCIHLKFQGCKPLKSRTARTIVCLGLVISFCKCFDRQYSFWLNAGLKACIAIILPWICIICIMKNRKASIVMIFINWLHIKIHVIKKEHPPFPRSSGFISSRCFGWKLCSAMSRKLALKTGLQGDIITLSAVEGDAPWEQNQRSKLSAKSSELSCFITTFQIIKMDDAIWCSRAGQNRVVGGWSYTNSHLQKKRSGSCNRSWCADTEGSFTWTSLPIREQFPQVLSKDASNLVSVTIPQSVSHIGNNALGFLPGFARTELVLQGLHIRQIRDDRQLQILLSLLNYSVCGGKSNNAIYSALFGLVINLMPAGASPCWYSQGALRFLGFQRMFSCKKVLKGTNREQPVTKQLQMALVKLQLRFAVARKALFRQVRWLCGRRWVDCKLQSLRREYSAVQL